MVAAEFGAAVGFVAVERGGAEEAAEARAGDVGVAFVVHVALVVVEEGVFLFGEGVGFQGHFKAVGGLDVGFQVGVLAFVYGGEEVKRGFLMFLLPESLDYLA